MQNVSVPGWQERELAQLQNEVAMLSRLLRALQPYAQELTESPGQAMEAPQQRSRKKSKKHYGALRGSQKLLLRI